MADEPRLRRRSQAYMLFAETTAVEFRQDLSVLDDSFAPIEWFEPLIRLLHGKRILYYPNPGNVGDDLITAATHSFFERIGTTLVTDWQCAEYAVFGGGGSLGDLYAPYMLWRDARMSEAYEVGLQCVVLPQSLTSGKAEFPPGTIVFARERMTHMRIPGSILVPDMVLSYALDPALIPPAIHGTGTFIRIDPEQVPSERENIGDPAYLVGSWQEYVSLAASYEHVITNRLHFAIAAMLAGRRATLLPNSYYKNRALYETWLRHLGCEWADA